MSELRHRRQQQMRSFWPCNGFLSPIVPGPNMPLPAPPPMQYPMAIPHAYQNVVPLNPPNGEAIGYGHYRGAGLRSMRYRAYEYQRIEDERVNRSGEPFDYLPSGSNGDHMHNLYGFESESEFKDASFSPSRSSTINSSDSSDQLNNMPLGFSAARLAGERSSNESGPTFCTPSTSKNNKSPTNDGPTFNSDGTVTVSQSKYIELARLALRGSEIAEKLAYTHRNRPCFKKIDSLCARMKQDLIRPDGVLPNINSQGIAWAIKDMIFVFTRIISAWIIIKGYVFNTPEGLNKVKAALCKDFVSRFLVWQDATFELAESLVRSFISLDSLVQTQKSAHQKSPDNHEKNFHSPLKTNSSSSTFGDKFDFYDRRAENSPPTRVGTDISKNYLYTMVKDSENSQREATLNGTYFKTGTYKPIKKDEYCHENVTPKNTVIAKNETQLSSPSIYTDAMSNSWEANQNPIVSQIHAAPSCGGEMVETTSERLYEYFDEGLYQKLSTGEVDIPMVEQYLRERLPSNWLEYGTRMFWRMFAERTLHSVKPKPLVNPEPKVPNILFLMVDRLMTLKSSDLFFKLQFSKNYFPKFIAKYASKLIDMRTIVLKSQVNKYGHVFEVVHDVRRIFYFAKMFLEYHVDPALVKAVNDFKIEFDNLLQNEPFNMYRYDHIIGDPRENLYL